MKKKIFSIFVWVGALYWLLIGGLVSIISFKLTLPIEVIKQSDELKREWSTVWLDMFWKTTVLWGLCGMVIGGIIYLIFTYRPYWEHNMPVSTVFPAPPMFRRPKTVSEVKTMPFVIVIAVVANLLMRYFVLSLVESSDLIVINPNPIPTIIVCVQAVMMSVLILPSSLKKVDQLAKQGYFIKCERS